MLKFVNTTGLFLFITIILSSCLDNSGKSSIKPKAISKSNDIVVIADKTLWQSEVGDTFKYYFESAYPITPNPEPLFKIRYFDYNQIDAERLRRELRTYVVLVNLADTSSKVTKMFFNDIGEKYSALVSKIDSFDVFYGHDKWARGQLIVYLAAKGIDNLKKAISSKFPEISEKIHKHDEPQIKIATYFSGHNAEAESEIKKLLNIKINIPKDYKIALVNKEEKFVWVRRDSKKAISNFVVEKLEYKDTTVFDKKNLINLINKFGAFVTSETEGSKLVVNDKDLPVLKFYKKNNLNYTVEYRGIWEMTKDFMGGPFVAWLVKKENSNDLIFMLGFVYGPGAEKKEYIQQLMAISNTLAFEK